MNKKNAIIYIAMGSAIVIIGLLFYLFEIVGAMGMVIIGFLVELYGIYLYIKARKTP